ncbi:preprotein translocase subunit SecA [Candidatus Dependentiae bacterium]|nr:preprotein translocase subunit SecA [Candidatus Dependentiae bacterium]
MATLLAKLFGTNNARQLKRMQPIVDKINALEKDIQPLTDDELSAKTGQFKEKVDNGMSLEALLPEAFAVVRETAKRKLGQRHFDVQLIGGIVLHEGRISEMKTGEGKTLTATLPLYLNALSGKGSHLVTVNDYLARRDAEWMAPVFNHLQLSIGVIQNSLSDAERKRVYNSDIVYATNNELGFDYLRDNMKFRIEDYVQRELNYAIVDEVDSILIDEARTPLIISGSSDESSRLYVDCDRALSSLVKDTDYEVDEKFRSVQLSESGIDKIERIFSVNNLYALDNVKLLHHVNQALKAHSLFKKDVHYVVKDDEVLIVDEFTGRILPGRRYSDGLHQAIEAKESVKIERESQTLASITLQNYFRLYKRLAGMTGTAATEAEEFHKIYKLDVISIPTNKKLIRDDKADLIFLSKAGKYKAIIEDVKARYEKGQPVLIGTIAIETSEFLSMMLTKYGVPHEVLNAKNHAREAEIVAHAGEKGRVTIATNMAGRGTDIKLIAESLEQGGLYILGTERHESRRIDNQLRGRAGRQGDPGESRFYISLEDDLIRIFAGDSIKKNMQRVGMTEEETIESSFISKTIENSQEKVEKSNFDTRRNLLEYDDVSNQQRGVVYKIRREILESEENIYHLILDMISSTVQSVVSEYVTGRGVTPEAATEVVTAVSRLTSIPLEDFEKENFTSISDSETLRTRLSEFLASRFKAFFNLTGDSENTILKDAHKWIMLENIDQSWKQHMLNLDHLKEGISLRSWGQKNPLIEYKREAFAMFEDMMRQVQAEIIQNVYHLNIEHFNSKEFERKRERELQDMNFMGPVDDTHGDITVQQASSDKIGRNEDCPCGSGKKYKKCCVMQ